MSSSDSTDGWGKQYVKFTFYKVRQELLAGGDAERAEMGDLVRTHLDASAERMLTRTYSTVGVRADTDLLVWQVADDLAEITDWHAAVQASGVPRGLDIAHSYLSMTMRSQYTNPLHEGSEKRDTLREDGDTNDYLFVYPMVKTRPWYALPGKERQRIMNEHIEIGHRYHGIKINTTYSFGLDDQEFVVAFEGDHPGEFLALVRDLRDSESSAYTLTDTPMFTCRRMDHGAVVQHIGLGSTNGA